MSDEFPTGAYEHVVDELMESRLRSLPGSLVAQRSDLPEVDGGEYLAAAFHDVLRAALSDLDAGRKVALVNDLVDRLALEGGADPSQRIVRDRPLLTGIGERIGQLPATFAPTPVIPLGAADLLVNAPGEPSLLAALSSEMKSADRIRIIMSFVKFSGLRLLEAQLREAIDRGVRVEVLTTTYMGATDQRAVDRLQSLGAHVRVNFDPTTTKLHAKGWLFERNSGLDTAYVGSSNLSVSAMTDGLEWNVRLTKRGQGHLIDKFRATFESYWDDPDRGFEPYDSTLSADRDRMRQMLEAAGVGGSPRDVDELLASLDLQPLPFQRRILEDLDAERHVYDRHENLVVAATGTGKTMVAAFDYRELAAGGLAARSGLRHPRLLYVAHRREILKQALVRYRAVLRRSDFGDLLVDGNHPRSWDHVFASVQSLTANNRYLSLPADHFDIIVMDEIHHAAADSWSHLLEHFVPQELIGLTATPERADGESILGWFGGRAASELRLWEALEQQILVPFHYFASGSEELDFSRARWSGGRYVSVDLDRVVTGNDAIMGWVLREIGDKVLDPRTMKALVFCVSVEHAEFVARSMSNNGIKSVVVHGDTPKVERDAARRALSDGQIQAITTVDVFNEGVDIPEVDTVIMLRPTESAVVFQQQLGRGLRKAPGKSVLTVLDFIGLQRREFRYDHRFSSVTNLGRSKLTSAIEEGFPYLPAGSSIQLDEVASTIVLNNIRESLPTRTAQFVADVRAHAQRSSAIEYTLGHYLEDAEMTLRDFYGSGRSWTSIARRAGLQVQSEGPEEASLLKRVAGLVHVDDLPRIDAYLALLEGSFGDASELERRYALMLHWSLWSDKSVTTARESIDRLLRNPAVVSEVVEILRIAREGIRHVSQPVPGFESTCPLRIHARYSRAEWLSALGLADFETSPRGQIAGVRRIERDRLDVFDMTWNKDPQRYSPTTRYRDYPVSRTRVHWESQGRATQDSPEIQRYVRHLDRGDRVWLFAREEKGDKSGTRPYLFLGPARYVSHSGERPVSFMWDLEVPMPADFFEQSLTAVA